MSWCRSHCLHSRCGCDDHWYHLQMQGYLAAMDTRPKPRQTSKSEFQNIQAFCGTNVFTQLSFKLMGHDNHCQMIKESHLYSSLMFTKGVNILAAVLDAAPLHTWPNEHPVVIASTGQVPAIWGPPQPTYLLGVTSEWADVMFCHPHIMMMNVSWSWATAETQISHV